MEGLIPVVNKLQDVFETIGTRKIELDLPQIVVIGSQSSGKSSVLENIVGRGFLPRGSGICTRRPLVLQLYHTAEQDAEWAEFLHVPNRRFTDFDEVRREIEIETDREVGKNKGVSSKAIRLKVYSPHVLNLTLVDLPGITKVPVGDQPSDIEDQIRDMCLEYVSNPLSIVLAVSPANADLANSDALKLAREVDPQGDRTIGILTKLDLMDDGVDALDMLTGRLIPLKLGYIGVVNRSQAEINAGTALLEARRKERAFFQTHPAYRAIAARNGTEHLTRTLNRILLDHIRENLPDLKAGVQKQLRDVDRELAALGSEAFDATDRTAQGQLILSLLSRYAQLFVDSIDGRGARGGTGAAATSTSTSTSTGTAGSTSAAAAAAAAGGRAGSPFATDPFQTTVAADELCGGARLAQAFRGFSARITDVSPFQNLSDRDIATAIMNATGARPSLFVPELSFEVLVRRQLGNLHEPALACVSEVYEVLQQVADRACFPALARFRALKELVLETVKGMLARALVPTEGMIENLIRIEQAFINTSHPDFVSRLGEIRNNPLGDAAAWPAASAGADNAGGRQHHHHHHVDSSASVASLASDPARARRRPSASVDLNGAGSSDDEDDAFSAAAAPASGMASAPPGTFNGGGIGVSSNSTSSNAGTAANSNNFMSFIFSDRGRLPPAPSATGSAAARAGSAGLLQTGGGVAGWGDGLGGGSAEADGQVRVIKRLMESYLIISRKNVLDLTPKTVMYFLVNHMKESVHNELIRALYKEQLFDDLLKEDEQVAVAREKLRETAALLQRALDILSEVRDYKV